MSRVPSIWEILLVTIQAGLFVVYFMPVTEITALLSDALRMIGSVPMVFGIILFVWALVQLGTNLSVFPAPKEGAVLQTRGVYHAVRHPIYAGLLYLAFGFAIFEQSFYQLIISFLLLFLFEIKSAYEERLLTDRFPAYAQYRLNTGKFFPYQWFYRRPNTIELEVERRTEQEEQ